MTTIMTTTMNPDIKARWTARLRSGEIEQGAKYLRVGDRRCCLGVLCDLADEAGIIETRPASGWWDEDDDLFVPEPGGRWDYGQDPDEEVLPCDVQAWSGLAEANPVVRIPGAILPRINDTARSLLGLGGAPGTVTLAQLNDTGVPFPVIADIIDATL